MCEPTGNLGVAPFVATGGAAVGDTVTDTQADASASSVGLLMLGGLDLTAAWCRGHLVVSCAPRFAVTQSVANGSTTLIFETFVPRIGARAPTAVVVAGRP